MTKTIKVLTALLISSSILGIGAGSAAAFSDVQDNDQLMIVKALQTKGIIQGIHNDKFAPQKSITSAQAIQMVVKAMGFKMNPNFSGKTFNTVPEAAWYADAVNIATQYGLPISADTKWNEPMNREDFANLLASAIQETGDYPLIAMYLHVADENQITKETRGSVQFLLLTKIATLDKEEKFHPKQELTRIEATEMTHAAMQFIETYKQINLGESEQAGDDISTQIVKINTDVNKIMITRHNLPHPGYGIKVTSIDFVSDKTAIIYYKLILPEMDKMYPQVISKSSVEVYVPSHYEVLVKQKTDR